MLQKTLLLYLSVFLLCLPLTSYATVEEDVAALDVRVTTAETDIITNSDRITALEAISIDNNASIVYLQKDCGTRKNCIDSLDLLITWIWETRLPDANNPLLVNIGPGTFARDANEWFCDGSSVGGQRGYVSFRGAGRLETSIVPAVDNTFEPISVNTCTDLSFSELTIDGGGADAVTAISWVGGGKSIWENVDVINARRLWYEHCGAGSPSIGLHYWFGSRLTSRGGDVYATYFSDCGETWFYNGDILANNIKVGRSQPSNAVAVKIEHSASMQIFGSSVRAIVDENASSVIRREPILHIGHGAIVANGGTVHMHGGIVSSLSKASVEANVFGVKSINYGAVHIIDTAFNVKSSGGGIADRVIIDALSSVQSPFQWPNDNEPPQILSMTGADTVVETDCDSNGDCSGNGTAPFHPHLMVYDDSCGISNPWFDMVTGQCRQ